MTENFKKLIKSYEILGLTPGQASLNDIQGAYRDLVKVWHPDRFANDPNLQHKAQEKMKEVNEAYQTIQDARENPTKYGMDEGGYYGKTGYYQEVEVINEEEAQQPPEPPPPSPPSSNFWARVLDMFFFGYSQQPPNSTPPPPSNPKNDKHNPDGVATSVWLIVLLIVCLGILAYGLFYSKNSTINLAFLFGYNLPSGLLIWAVFYAVIGPVIGRKQGKKNAGLAFLAIYSSLIVGDLIGYSQQKNAAIQAITEIQKGYSSIVQPEIDSQGSSQRIEKRVDTTPTTKGEFGELERFIKTFMNQMASQRNDYLLELNAIGWEKILDPERLKADKTLIESKVTIRKAKDIVNKYRSKTYMLLDKTRKNISNLNVSESSRREMASGFDRGMEKSRQRINAIWDLEAKAIAEFENIFALLSARKGAWDVQGGQILFSSEDDLNAFNSYVVSGQDLLRQQEVIQKQSIETVNSNLNRLKESFQQSPKHDGTISVFTDYEYGQIDVYIDGVYARQLNRYFPNGYTDPKCEGLGTVSKTLQAGEHKLYAKNPNGTVWPEWTFYIKEGECRIVKLPKPLVGSKWEKGFSIKRQDNR